MERIRKVIHKGKNILVVDVSHCLPAETIQVMPAAKKIVAGFPPKSGLILTVVTGATYNKEVAEAIKDFSSHNTPYIKGSAVVGIQGIQSVLLQTVIFLTHRDIKVFDTEEKALDYLASV